MVSISIAFLSHRTLDFRETVFNVLPSLGFLCLSDFYLPHLPSSTRLDISVSTLCPSTTNSIPLLQGLRVRSFLRKLSVTDHVPCSSFGLSHFPHRRGNLYMFVFSDGIKLPHRHVTGSVSHQFLGAHLSLSMSVWCRFP